MFKLFQQIQILYYFIIKQICKTFYFEYQIIHFNRLSNNFNRKNHELVILSNDIKFIVDCSQKPLRFDNSNYFTNKILSQFQYQLTIESIFFDDIQKNCHIIEFLTNGILSEFITIKNCQYFGYKSFVNNTQRNKSMLYDKAKVILHIINGFFLIGVKQQKIYCVTDIQMQNQSSSKQTIKVTKLMHSNSSPIHLPTKFVSIPQKPESQPMKKNRKVFYTQDKTSQISINKQQELERNINDDTYTSQSRTSKISKQQSNDNLFKVLTDKESKIIQLKERIKNIQYFYQIKIEDQRNKNIERNQLFIGIIQQLQKNHNQKIYQFQKTLQQLEDDHQQLRITDQRMGTIKTNIEGILQKSQQLKIHNNLLQKQLLKKQLITKQKQKQLLTKKQQLDFMRSKLQQFELFKLKQNKRKKQLLQMINYTF